MHHCFFICSKCVKSIVCICFINHCTLWVLRCFSLLLFCATIYLHKVEVLHNTENKRISIYNLVKEYMVYFLFILVYFCFDYNNFTFFFISTLGILVWYIILFRTLLPVYICVVYIFVRNVYIYSLNHWYFKNLNLKWILFLLKLFYLNFKFVIYINSQENVQCL